MNRVRTWLSVRGRRLAPLLSSAAAQDSPSPPTPNGTGQSVWGGSGSIEQNQPEKQTPTL
jgi:hypothetical protein